MKKLKTNTKLYARENLGAHPSLYSKLEGFGN